MPHASTAAAIGSASCVTAIIPAMPTAITSVPVRTNARGPTVVTRRSCTHGAARPIRASPP